MRQFIVRTRICFAAFYVYLSAGFVVLHDSHNRLTDSLSDMAIPVLVCWIAVSVWWILRNYRALRARVHDSDYRLCLDCGFDLRASGDSGICPECGLTFSYIVMRERWQEWCCSPISHMWKRIPCGKDAWKVR